MIENTEKHLTGTKTPKLMLYFTKKATNEKILVNEKKCEKIVSQ